MLRTLEFKHCTAILVREHWFMGECRGEADVLYLQIDRGDWFAIAYDKQREAFTASQTTGEEARRIYGSGESHHPLKDIGQVYHLDDCMITQIDQQRLVTGAELCMLFDNATEITIHCNPLTEESSLYITHH